MLRPNTLSFTLLLGALTATTALATDMSLPALPTLAAVFAASADEVQLTLSLFVLGYGGGQLVYGPLSDRFGRRPLLLAGLVIYTAAGFACALAPSIGALVGARFVQGLGGCVGPILGRAVVRDHFSGIRAAQMLSYVTVVFALAPLVAPSIGGVLLDLFGWRAIFLTFGGFGLALSFATWLGFGESLSAPDPQALAWGRLLANARLFFANRRCVGAMLVNCFIFAGLFAFISGSPFVFIEVYGVPPGRFGLYFAMSALAVMAGAAVNGRLVRHLPPIRVLRIGLSVLALAGLAALGMVALGWSGPFLFMLAVMGYVFAQGISMPNSIATAMEPLPQMAGMAASLLGAVQMAGGAAAGYAVNVLYDGTALPMAAIIAAMGVGALLSYHLTLSRIPRDERHRS
jgi:MFS transporter, DHA1 family, multidrug resistance protein